MASWPDWIVARTYVVGVNSIARAHYVFCHTVKANFQLYSHSNRRKPFIMKSIGKGGGVVRPSPRAVRRVYVVVKRFE